MNVVIDLVLITIFKKLYATNPKFFLQYWLSYQD